jgi:hypothetical protein
MYGGQKRVFLATTRFIASNPITHLLVNYEDSDSCGGSWNANAIQIPQSFT